MKALITSLWWQVYNQILIPNSWNEYRGILQSAQAGTYTFLRLDELADLIKQKAALPHPFIVLRHDIDTDCKSALQFAKIEAKLGIKASYFFRRKTWIIKYIEVIAGLGHETGYHYEELATYAKNQHLKQARVLESRLEEMRAILSTNLHNLRKDIPINSLASHGDFANRKLGLTNCMLASNEVWRTDMGISYEAYDPWLLAAYQNHVSDKPYPQRFYPKSPQSYIAAKQSFLFLSHPRWWQPNPAANLCELWDRIKDQITW